MSKHRFAVAAFLATASLLAAASPSRADLYLYVAKPAVGQAAAGGGQTTTPTPPVTTPVSTPSADTTGSLTGPGQTCSGAAKTILVREVHATVGVPISLTAPTVCNGADPYVYEPEGSPGFDVPGLTVDQLSGALSGIPAQAGSFTTKVSVFDNANATISSPSFTVVVGNPTN